MDAAASAGPIKLIIYSTSIKGKGNGSGSVARRRRSWSVFRQLSLCGAGVVFAVGWEVVRLAVGQQLPPLALVSDDGCRT